MGENSLKLDILILHDFFSNIGGAEWVAVEMARHYNAPIATFDPPTGDKRFKDIDFINLGKSQKYPSGYKETSVWIKNWINGILKKYDDYDLIIINKEWCKSAASATKTNSLYYCHTPDRHLYDLNNYTYNRLKKNHSLTSALIFKIWSPLMRIFDQRAVKKADKIVCNSKNVKKRIQKYYGLNPKVIYPPVDTKEFYFEKIGNYWLTVSRLNPVKRIEFLIKIFNETEETLKIVGPADREEELKKYKKLANDNIQFTGEISWRKLKKLYANCKATITVAKDEDFGLTPIESMASGKPVLAVNEGGYKETIINKKTGWLLPPKKERFKEKISKIDKQTIMSMKKNCQKNAEKFNKNKFFKNLDKTIKQLNINQKT
ncbi:Glycosyltransferase, AglL family [Methanonatronarchaeum thermophilum]|uniref:Glycosyltransferase, AglL family n=1 Tax=Methanonatronarchaeum thermophilum TaxID=1927129 RepID=A0A1Y3GCY4_9EURY|nr:glycosyltransferase [Methanonatronarchaeum thermophilum]OUJ19308.1 Glycosyltransferase, AglL family [Methanonatronarchaeum thermophilum]